jgi:TAT (twin-arginine translocation) pathway signal sequence
MAKFTRRNFIGASAAAGIVAGAVAAPALPQAITALSSSFNLNGTSAAYKRGEATL